jgi:phenylalanyl-tRNA synthetase alpha chain
MTAELTEGERTVLRELLSLGERASASRVAKSLNQREERIVSIFNSLAEKDIVNLQSREIVSHTLTEEGKEYREHGLPEVRLFDAVSSLGGQAALEDAVKKANLTQKEKGIAINWARRNGWLSIAKEDESTMLKLTSEEVESSVAKILINILEGEGIMEPSKPLEQVLDRSLATSTTTKVFEASIPASKTKEAQKLSSVETAGIGDLTPEMIQTESWKGKSFRPYNVESIPPTPNKGKRHPYSEFNDWLKEILVGLGFTEWFGPYVETEFWNNDTLFVPQDHVAREVQDQFRVGEPYTHGTIRDKEYYKAVKAVHENGGETGSIGWQAPFSEEIAKRLCLRAHTTPVSMRYLWEHRESPQKMFIIDRNFRSESLSATHAQEFNQCEGIIMDRGLTLRDLMGYISEICRRVGIKKFKFKPGQFPFTEPSVECFAKHDTLGWIEVAPGGIFRPEVTRPLGIKDPVLAWGIGSGRLYMASMGIDDIRDLYSRDLTWLRRTHFLGGVR